MPEVCVAPRMVVAGPFAEGDATFPSGRGAQRAGRRLGATDLAIRGIGGQIRALRDQIWPYGVSTALMTVTTGSDGIWAPGQGSGGRLQDGRSAAAGQTLRRPGSFLYCSRGAWGPMLLGCRWRHGGGG